jgi:hypothetical protein
MTPDRDDDDETIQRARARSAAIPEPVLMPFGRHKGEPVSELPGDYVCWLMTAEIRSPRLRAAIELAHAQYCTMDHAPDPEPWR